MASLKERLQASPPRVITVIRTDRVGDLILSTPFLTVLRQAFPQATIAAIVDPYCQEVLAESGLVDKILTDLPGEGQLPGPSDLTIALAPRTGSLKLARRTGAPLRLGYVYRGRPLVRLAARFLLTHVEEVTVNPPHHVPHEIEQLDLLARRLGLPPSTGLPLQLGFTADRVPGRVVFHLGDRWLAGGWSLSDLSDLLEGLRRFPDVQITAGPREEKMLAEGGLSLHGLRLRTNLAFEEWAQLLGSAEALLSPDTGAVHLAAAMKTPVVVGYEASTYEHCSRQWAPWMVPHRSVVKGAPGETIPKLLAGLEELVSNSRNGAT